MAVRTLTPTGLARLADIPVQMRGDPDIKACIDVMAQETDYGQALLQGVTDGFFPPRDDVGVYFNIWELEYGLSVQPVGYTTAQRQARDLATIQGNWSAASGLASEQAAATYLGSAFAYSEYLDAIVNGTFEIGTTAGWSAAAGVFIAANGVLTAQTIPQTVHSGQHSMLVQSTASPANQGAEASLAGTYFAGRTYNMTAWAAGVSGGEQVQLQFGTAADHATTSPVTLTTSMQQLSASWTPSANRTGVAAAIQLPTAVSRSLRVDDISIPTLVDTTTIFLSFAHTDPRAAGVEAFFRNLLPAHIALSFVYGDGFTIGVSLIGVDTL